MCRGDWKFSRTLHYLNKYEDNVKFVYISQKASLNAVKKYAQNHCKLLHTSTG